MSMTIKTLIISGLLFFAGNTYADMQLAFMSEGCRSCIDSKGCERENKSCRRLCNSRLIADSDKLAECGMDCTVAWKACDTDAKAACSFYCKDEEES